MRDQLGTEQKKIKKLLEEDHDIIGIFEKLGLEVE